MNELEFVKKLIFLLSESDKRNIIKHAVAKGFEVHGFSNKPYNAPKNIINSNLTRKNKKSISNYFLILDAIDKFPLEQAENKELIQLAKDWINDDERRINKERELHKLYMEVNIERTINDDVDTDNDSEENNNYNSGTQNELEEKNNLLQKKNKELKEKLKGSKIELDNLRKDLNICIKEEKKQLAEIKRLNQLVEEYDLNNKQLETKLQDSRSYSNELLSQVEVLNHYKDNALKIACFVKNSQSIQFDGYNITFFDEWNEQMIEDTDVDDYSEVWYIHEGFNYNCFLEVKKYFKCRIREYMSIKKLLNGA